MAVRASGPQEILRENGSEFNNHYIGSAACSPSRATFYTGQYPSLHGATQTSGATKTSFDPDMFWLDRYQQELMEKMSFGNSHDTLTPQF